MLSNSVILKQEYTCRTFFERFFAPGLHYRPINITLTDLKEVILNSLDVHNDGKMEKMAKAASERAKIITQDPSFMDCYWAKLFGDFSSSLGFRVEPPPGSKKIGNIHEDEN